MDFESSGPQATFENYDGQNRLETKHPSVGLFPGGDLTASALRERGYFGSHGFTEVRKGSYTAALFYWDAEPQFPTPDGIIGDVIVDGPQETFTILGNELLKEIDLGDYNPTGAGPTFDFHGRVYVTGNPPYGGNAMQVVLMPQFDAPGLAPAAGFVESLTLASTFCDGNNEFSTAVHVGPYLLGFAAESPLRWRDGGDFAPRPVEVNAETGDVILSLRNNHGSRPAGLGQITGEVVLGGKWVVEGEAPLLVMAQYGSRSHGGVGDIRVTGCENKYHQAYWLITPEDVQGDRATFMLGWLEDAKYFLRVIKGDEEWERFATERVGPTDFEVDGIVLDPGVEE